EVGIPSAASDTRETAEQLLTGDAIKFLARLHRQVEPTRIGLLDARQERWEKLRSGETPGFLEDSARQRTDNWRVKPVPTDLQVRKVEITGPTDRKMVTNALNSGASVFMADFEDANTPTWENMVSGQVNLVDAVRRTIALTSPEGKRYTLHDTLATLVVRPRA